jgi:hypothetical protein
MTTSMPAPLWGDGATLAATGGVAGTGLWRRASTA